LSLLITNMVDEKLKNILFKTGLSEKEALVYLAFLEGGRFTVTQAAALAGLKRSIVYKIIENLKQKGFVSEMIGDKVKVFSANDPVRILRKAEDSVDDLRFFLPMLRGLFQGRGPKPKVEFYDDKEGVKTMFSTFGLAKETRYISSYARLEKEFPEEVEQWIRLTKAHKTGIHYKQLVVNEPESLLFAKRISTNPVWEVRILPEDTKFDIDFGIIDKKIVSLVSFVPPFIALIHSETIAESLSNLFDLIWQVSDPFKQGRKKKTSS